MGSLIWKGNRHLEALALLACGLQYHEAAAVLGLGKRTVDGHLERARYILDARNATQAFFHARERGLISDEMMEDVRRRARAWREGAEATDADPDTADPD